MSEDHFETGHLGPDAGHTNEGFEEACENLCGCWKYSCGDAARCRYQFRYGIAVLSTSGQIPFDLKKAYVAAHCWC